MINPSCIGCWTCCSICKELFELKDWKAVMLKDIETTQEEASYELAKNGCPLSCIE